MGGSQSSMNSYPGQRHPGGSMQPNPSYVRRHDNSTNRPNSTSTTGPRASGSSSSGVRTISQPGAFSISRNSTTSPDVYRVRIPPNVRPGQEFQVYAGSRLVRVRCPQNGEYDA